MADTAGTGTEQPSPEELQAYLEQMRKADAAEIVAQAFQILAMGAEVKLGRPDARILIDALAAVVESTGGRVPENLTTGMKNAVTQLQTAQVQNERAAAGHETTESTETAASGAADTSSPSGQPQGTSRPTAESEPRSGQNMTDRLWIPGR